MGIGGGLCPRDSVASFWLPWVALGLYAFVALMWLIPDRRIEKVLGRGS